MALIDSISGPKTTQSPLPLKIVHGRDAESGRMRPASSRAPVQLNLERSTGKLGHCARRHPASVTTGGSEIARGTILRGEAKRIAENCHACAGWLLQHDQGRVDVMRRRRSYCGLRFSLCVRAGCRRLDGAVTSGGRVQPRRMFASSRTAFRIFEARRYRVRPDRQQNGR